MHPEGHEFGMIYKQSLESFSQPESERYNDLASAIHGMDDFTSSSAL